MSSLIQKTINISKKYNISPKRSKGQNFLINESVYNQIVEVADLQYEDIVLEVGPGLGFLTEKLAEKVNRVVAVELDDGLTEVLRARLKEKEIGNVEVINEDVLKIFNFQFSIFNFKIIANLPYNITSIFLRKVLELENKPKSLTLMLQKEVAKRITAEPGKMSKLTVSVQFYADAEILFNVPKTDFWPEPKVDSAVIELKIKSKKYKVDDKRFFQLVRIGFSARRKKLKNNLASGYQIKAEEAGERLKLANLNPDCRAQDLGVQDWIKLLGYFS
ncbi:MAG: 16S rRNA (adenine(1518)-N(6)/adenine(1519)-N(6))-dimethyltransferase RsmA [Patescibacteria group bacterium]|nr:16S rRNA (adenine(1518)-N(6)/adenine(1519)-N(6))-dimethyltransferase RsmA [Patescibacteria group bacterium]